VEGSVATVDIDSSVKVLGVDVAELVSGVDRAAKRLLEDT
jgi:hypothetical protein